MIHPDRLRAMHRQCWVRRGDYSAGACPCDFESQCRVPTEELLARLREDAERVKGAMERLRRGGKR